jgi:EAL domain-containing protein (putative c-di-GMP-specific phosphodiesterase class I)
MGGHELVLSASVGVCAARSDDGDPGELVANAATAAYEASRAGGRQFTMFDRSMRTRLLERVSTERALHCALGNQELVVHYQPIIDMSSSSTVGLEALVRWRHPELGLVGPERFIQVAEDTGLIIPIGAWVLEEACRQLGSWRSGPWPALGSVAVNLSARQLEDPEVIELVREVTARTSLPSRSLVCEITESTLMRDAEASLRVLGALKAGGVVLAIDDFGTGYSSLSYLRRLPVDILKIDKCFVQSVAEVDSAKIVAAIVNLGHDLGMVVAAEGVETAAQAQVLRALGCDLAQGIWYAPPLEAWSVTRERTTLRC